MNTIANTNPNGTNDMNLIHEDLARVISSGRRAEQVAQQARLAIARTL